MDNVLFVEIIKTFKDLMNIEFDEGFWENGSFADVGKRTSFNVLEYEIYFMIFNYCVFILDNIFMVESFKNVNLLLDRPNVLLADGYFLQGYENHVVEVNPFVNLTIGSFADFLNQLVTLNYFCL